MRIILQASTACAIAMAGHGAHATGIPVIDVANLVQTIQQVMNDITKIQNQVQQITALQSQLNSMTGARNLGSVVNNPSLQNYVPANAYTVVNGVDASGYTALTGTARSLRDAGMVYNCLDLAGAQRTSCQATLAQPYQHKGLLQDAMRSASSRLGQINALMGQVNANFSDKSQRRHGCHHARGPSFHRCDEQGCQCHRQRRHDDEQATDVGRDHAALRSDGENNESELATLA